MTKLSTRPNLGQDFKFPPGKVALWSVFVAYTKEWIVSALALVILANALVLRLYVYWCNFKRPSQITTLYK
jgi:hypothetical protein